MPTTLYVRDMNSSRHEQQQAPEHEQQQTSTAADMNSNRHEQQQT
jgi:hypothetical protein